MKKGSRKSGVLVPLFSMRTENSLGIGDLGDVVPTARWLKDAGFSLLQILPPMTLPAGETSPYGAMTAFAIDPNYVAPRHLHDLTERDIHDIEDHGRRLEAAPRVHYVAARLLKESALRTAWMNFRELPDGHARREAFREFSSREASWLDDYALFVAIREHLTSEWAPVLADWPAPLRTREPSTLSEMRERLAARCEAVRYEQWCLDVQWSEMRAGLAEMGIALMGDVPFVVGRESADAWSHPTEFQHGVSLGVPPDDFSPDGQDWGLPPFDWKAADSNGLAWHRARARRASTLYDCFRIDHVVGLFRQYVRRPGALGEFDPADEAAQRSRGEAMLSVLIDGAGHESVIAEDLGVIPPFVRQTLAAMSLPGYRVIPWEREGLVYRDPKLFPEKSVACLSTHDTSPIGLWWTEMSPEERTAMKERMQPSTGDEFRDLTRLLFEAASDLVLVSIQEVVGEDVRINLPGSVGAHNWTYRIAKTPSQYADDSFARSRVEWLARLASDTGRNT